MLISQVIVFTQRPEFKMLLEIECRGNSLYSLLVQKGLEDFKSILNLLNSIDVLVIDCPDDQEVLASLLLEVSKKRGAIKEMFFLSDAPIPFERINVYPRNEIESLLTDLKKMINPPDDMNEGYISVPVESLIHFKLLPFDLFIKVGEDKFFKRIPAHEEIGSETFASFFQRGVTNLYFEKRYNRDFSSMLINHMINNVEKEYEAIEDKLLATNHVYQTTHQIVAKLGFKPKLIKVCESVMNQILGDVSNGKENFVKFLDQLRHQRELSFSYRLMELTSFIGTQMIESMETNGQEEKIKRLVFAAMFCDLALENPNQVHIRKTDQLSKLSQSEQKLISEHAFKGSEQILNYASAPIEAAAIIKQHHGSASGVGFPKEISSKILSLSKCFIAAQELSYEILTQEHRDPSDIVNLVRLNYLDTPLEEYLVQFQKSCQA